MRRSTSGRLRSLATPTTASSRRRAWSPVRSGRTAGSPADERGGQRPAPSRDGFTDGPAHDSEHVVLPHRMRWYEVLSRNGSTQLRAEIRPTGRAGNRAGWRSPPSPSRPCPTVPRRLSPLSATHVDPVGRDPLRRRAVRRCAGRRPAPDRPPGHPRRRTAAVGPVLHLQHEHSLVAPERVARGGGPRAGRRRAVRRHRAHRARPGRRLGRATSRRWSRTRPTARRCCGSGGPRSGSS